MAFIPAKCSQCGAEINVDNTLEYGYCSHCGTKYITEKIIKNESIYIENQTNINLNFADERKQCELLLSFIKNYDLDNVKSLSLKILENNPQNKLAKMFYEMHMQSESYTHGDFISFSFSTTPVKKYFQNNKGKIDVEFSLQILTLISQKTAIEDEDCDCVREIINNVENLPIDNLALASFYVGIFELANQGNASLKRIRKINRQSRMGGLKTFILTDNEYLAADVKEYHKDIKKINNILEQSKNNFLSAINDCFKKTRLPEEERKKILKFKNKERNKNIILFCFVFAIIMLIYLLSYL